MWNIKGTRFTKQAYGTFAPDSNKLELYCANQLVGTCQFDLSSYIDKKPVVQKAMIMSSADAGAIGLQGDANQYPGAFIEFRATVASQQTEESKQAAAAMSTSSRTT